MNKIFLSILPALFLLLLVPVMSFAHCEIPCGIYDDGMRIEMILEHVTTIEKSMKQIRELENHDHHNANQLVRWVMNKERHADEIQEIVAQYFMTQRIKPGMKDYEKKLTLLHQMLIFSMKCKQTTDLDHVEAMRALVSDFDKLYFGK